MRWAVLIFEIALVMYWAIILWTQIILPLYRGTKLFPYFRDDITTQVVKANTDLEREADEAYLENLRKSLRQPIAAAVKEGEKE